MQKKAIFIIFFLSFFFCVFSQNVILKQKITASYSNSTIQSVLEDIEKKSSITFIYNSEEISKSRRITASYYDKTVEYVLSRVLSTGYVYKQVGDQVIISQKNKKNTIGASSVQSVPVYSNDDTIVVYDSIRVVFYDTVVVTHIDTLTVYDTVAITKTVAPVYNESVLFSVENIFSLPVDAQLNGVQGNTFSFFFQKKHKTNNIKLGLGITSGQYKHSSVINIAGVERFDTLVFPRFVFIDSLLYTFDSVYTPVAIGEMHFFDSLVPSLYNRDRVITEKNLTFVSLAFPVGVSRKIFLQSGYIEPEILLQGNVILSSNQYIYGVDEKGLVIRKNAYNRFFMNGMFSCSYGNMNTDAGSYFIKIGAFYALTPIMKKGLFADSPKTSVFLGFGLNF